MRSIEEVRADIDTTDIAIFNGFARRLELSGEMASVKADLGIDTCDPAREEELMNDRAAQFPYLDPDEVRGLQKYLIEAGKRIQAAFREQYEQMVDSAAQS